MMWLNQDFAIGLDVGEELQRPFERFVKGAVCCVEREPERHGVYRNAVDSWKLLDAMLNFASAIGA